MSSFGQYRDDSIFVDRDGVPHWTGEQPELFREWKKRSALMYAGCLEEKDKKALGVKLLTGLHGKETPLVRRVPERGTAMKGSLRVPSRT